MLTFAGEAPWRERLRARARAVPRAPIVPCAVRFARGEVRAEAASSWADELASCANNDAGGVVLLGIDASCDDVVGIPVERLDAVERVLLHVCCELIAPPLAPIIERLTLPDLAGNEQPVMRVVVARSLFVHQSPGGYLHRVGSSKRQMPPDHLARLFQQRSQSRLIRFDETPVPRATLADLDERLWRRFAPAMTDDPAETLLRKLAMAAQDEDGEWRPTVAGLLLGSDRAQQYLPGAFIQAVAYQGTDVVPEGERMYQRDAQDIAGPLDRQILEACAFVRKNMRVAAFKYAGGGREDVPQFAMRAVFEAVTNAVAHRDYSMPGSKVRMRLFDDRLEIFSPGMLPNTMSPDSLALRQAARNEAVTSLLARCPISDAALAPQRQHIMDKRGEGVPVILAETERLSGRTPSYELIDQSELRLVIPAAVPVDEAQG